MIVITPSGGRPEALKLLNIYLERQTFQDFKWIILDDVEPYSPIPSRCDHYIIADWVWNGKTTQSKSMVRLLEEVTPDDKVIVCEDDDWYAPNHLEVMNKSLDDVDAVGLVNTIYYNVANRTHTSFRNRGNSCMCQTGVKGKAVDFLRQVCISNPPERIDLDIIFWDSFNGSVAFIEEQTVIGIKGLPGRNGLGMGHKMNGKHDRDSYYLRELIGDDADNYL